MRFSRRRTMCMLAATLFIVWFAAREFRDASTKDHAFSVVAQLGGSVGSIPVWPIGDEIRIEFHDARLSETDLQRLAVAIKPLTGRHSVGVMFDETNVTRSDVLELRRALPDALIFRVEDGVRTDDR